MMCPVCRAGNEPGNAACRRCRADLSLVVAVEATRGHWIESAKNAIAEGKFAEALRSLSSAAVIRPGTDLARLQAIAHLQNRDFPAAYACYRAAHE
ncbi:MAG: hypothetical protein ACRC8S_18745 [Fimbriiglobus sp.]